MTLRIARSLALPLALFGAAVSAAAGTLTTPPAAFEDQTLLLQPAVK